MTDLPDGTYLKNLQTGEFRPIKLACEPSEADVPDGEQLFLRDQGEWIGVIQAKTDAHLERLRQIGADLWAAIDDYEAGL